jgi:hypothetical protein
VEIVEEKEKVEVKEDGEGGVEVKKEETKVTAIIEKEEIKHKEVVAPYFIPCSHPRFVNYSHPDFHHYGGCEYAPHYLGYHSRPEFINDENPYACSIM